MKRRNVIGDSGNAAAGQRVSSAQYPADMQMIEKRRFLKLNTTIALLLALFMLLFSAHTALAWLVDEDFLTSEMELGELEERSYASVVQPANQKKTILVLGRGAPSFSDDEVLETFFEIEDLSGEDAPWKAYLSVIEDVIFDGIITPVNTSRWFFGATKLISLNLTGLSGERLVSSFEMLAGCDHLEKLVIPSDFRFGESGSGLMDPDGDCVPDADGNWYVLDEKDTSPLSSSEVVNLVNMRYLNADISATTIYGYGPGYAALYGESILVFGRGVPAETYGGTALQAIHRGIETGDGDFNPNASDVQQTKRWGTSLTSVQSVAKRSIKTPSIRGWFYGNRSLKNIDLSSIDLSECTSMDSAFTDCSSLVGIDVGDWDIHNVQTMSYAFSGCSSLEELDVSRWDTSSLGKQRLSLHYVFNNCAKLETIDTSNWSIELEDAFFYNMHRISTGMFVNCAKLTSIDLSGFKLPERYYSPDGASYLNWWSFAGCTSLEKITLPSSFCFTNNDLPTPQPNNHGIINSYYWYEDMQGEAFTSNEVCQTFRDSYRSDFNTITTRTFYAEKAFGETDAYAAYYVNPATSQNILVFDRGAVIPDTFEGAKLSNAYREIEKRCGGNNQNSVPWSMLGSYVKDVRVNASLRPLHGGYWFYNFSKMSMCRGLDLLDMSACVSMSFMFRYCALLETLDLSAWDVSSCTNFANMFDSCLKLTSIKVDGWHLSDELSRYALECLFQDCYALTEIDLSSWTLQQSFDANSQFSFVATFDDCSSLTKISFPHLSGQSKPVQGNTPYNAYYPGTFKNCGNLEELVVPNDFTFNSAIIPNGKTVVGNVVNNGLWYEDRQGDSHNAAELWDNLTTRFRDGSKASHWYVQKSYTDGDVFAAVYENALVFDCGSVAPDVHDGQELMQVYREIERADFNPAWTNDSTTNTAIREVWINVEIQPRKLARWFQRLVALNHIEGLDRLKTGFVEDFSYLFYQCESLIDLDVSHFDMSSSRNLTGMFRYMTSLTHINLFSLDATLDHTLALMFDTCASLKKLDFSAWTLPRWNRTAAASNLMRDCSSLEEFIVSPSFNFSDLAKDLYGSGSIPKQHNAEEGFMRALLWYENGQGRGYTFYDADAYINSTANTKSESTRWTRYPDSGAYAAIYKAYGTDSLSLVFGQGDFSCLVDAYPGYELLDIAFGYDYYAWALMSPVIGAAPPWTTSYKSANIKEVIVKDAVKPVDMTCWFENFLNCTKFDVSKLDTSNVKDLYKCFARCESMEELDLSAWDTSKVTRYGGGGYNSIFYNCLNLKKISLANWDLSSLTTKNEMFSICPALEEIDMSGCVYENAPTLMSQCFKLRKVIISPEVSFAGEFFTASSDVNEGFDGKWYLESDLGQSFTTVEAKSYINERYRTTDDAVTLIAGYGSSAYAAVYKNPNAAEYKLAFGRGFADLAIDGWPQEAVYRGLESSVYNSFGEAPQNSSVPWRTYRANIIEIANKVPADDLIKPLSLNSWFYEMSRISSIDLSLFEVSATNDIANILYGCTSLSDLRGLEAWDVSNVESMSSAFAGVVSDFGSSIRTWDTASLKNMSWMFWNCKGLISLDLVRWDTSKLMSNTNAFYQCINLENLVLPKKFVTRSITEVGQMFMECRSLRSLDVSAWDISGLKDINGLFYNCRSLETIVGIDCWDTSSITQMTETFYKCHRLAVNCSAWNVTSVADYSLFSYEATGVVEPFWQTTDQEAACSATSPDEALDAEDVFDQSAATNGDSEGDDLIMKAGDVEMVLDKDAKPMSEATTGLASFVQRLYKQLMFMVDLKTGEIYGIDFFR